MVLYVIAFVLKIFILYNLLLILGVKVYNL